jgi:hypothetical protein
LRGFTNLKGFEMMQNKKHREMPEKKPRIESRCDSPVKQFGLGSLGLDDDILIQTERRFHKHMPLSNIRVSYISYLHK